MTSPEHTDPEVKRIRDSVRNDILEHRLNFPLPVQVIPVLEKTITAQQGFERTINE